MPPLSSKKSEGDGTIQKEVEFVAKDAGEQVATGIVMVPDKVDLQNDFVREDQIREFSEQFENFEEVGEAGGGIMHAVFPDDWLDLERNEVLDEAEEIGGETAPAGAWVQSWGYNNDDLWKLVEDGTFAGYSIGLDSVRWDGPYEQSELDDVHVPSEIDEDELVWQIVDGIMREVSTVDIPAVPDAEILERADSQKALRDHLGNRDAFVEAAMGRGHSEEKAEEMWDVLSEAAEIEGAGEPGKESVFAKAGKAFLSALTGGDDGDDGPKTAGEEGGYGVVRPSAQADDATKEGRTLSTANQESAMAAVDANLDLLEDAGVDHGMTRFTDQDGVDFDLSEHDAREWSATDEGDEADEEIEYAAGGETPDDDTTETDMSNDDPDGEDEKSLAEKNAEQIDDLSETVDEIHRAITGEEKTREIELGGETVEVSESELKSALGVETEPDEDVSTEERLKTIEARLDAMAEQSGASNQIRASATGDNGDEDGSKLNEISKALS